MKSQRFENAPFRSLMNDSVILKQLKERADTLGKPFVEGGGVGLEGFELIAPEITGVSLDYQAEVIETKLDKKKVPDVPLDAFEAIILAEGRPALLIRDGKWEQPTIPAMASRLDAAQQHLLAAIPKTARLELLNHPTYEYLGTAWMIDEDIMMTNRHVANAFAVWDNARYIARSSPFGAPYQSQVDFNAEYNSPNDPFEVAIEEILYIEKDASYLPDMALVRIKKVAGLPAPIALSTKGAAVGDDIAVIGYPARDPRNDAVVMRNIFNDIYEVKRLSPGRVSLVRDDRFLFTHDCTTLGGNSGSVIVSLDSGDAVGLHFAGSYMQNNYAVTSETLRAKMQELRGKRIIPVVKEKEPSPGGELADRTGYDPDFLVKLVPMPIPDPAVVDKIAPVARRDDGFLQYTHFTVVQHKERRMALYTACNIDGATLYKIPRGTDKWAFDPRMDEKFQAGNDLYRDNPLDRGHLVRRLDPAWGEDREEAVKAVDDTFYYTNCSPQHARLNQRSWLNLEEYILENAATHELKVSVFTGPVFNDFDREYRGYRIPQEYWKVVAIVNDFTGELSATGYLLTQADLVNHMEFVYGEYQTYQIPIKTIESKTGLKFAELRKFDPLDIVESLVVRVIDGADSLVL